MADLQKAEKLHQATITSAGKLQPSLEALIADYKKIAPRQSDAKAHNDELHKLREERRQLLEQKNALTRQLRALQAND